jgi:intraflagellar transport protein 46
MAVRRLENVDRDSASKKAIDSWINNINELHRQKPAPVVHYSKPMPDVEALMQEWPRGLEDLLNKVRSLAQQGSVVFLPGR